ncbi:MAG: hypothetical protein K9H84_00355 [Bacteroidales bacterium]|nr:hypothetical protein [Bacteroidales bacterium]
MRIYRAYRIFFYVIISFYLFSCQKIIIKDSEYFGRLPYLFKKHELKTSKLEKESKLTSSVGHSLEIKSEIKKLDNKFENLYKQEINKIEFPVYLPFEGHIDYGNYKIQSVYVSEITINGRVRISAKAISSKNNICPFAFARFVNKDNEPNGKNAFIILTLQNYYHGQIAKNAVTKDEQFTLEGFYPIVADLTNVKKIIFVSEKTYFNDQ